MKSLKHKITLPVLVLATVGFMVLSVISYIEGKRIILKHVEAISNEKVEKLVIKVEDKLEHWKEVVNLLAVSDVAESMNKMEFLKNVSNNRELLKEFEVVIIADSKGNFFSTNGVSGNITDREYYFRAMRGETVVSQPFMSKTTANPIIIITAPIKNKSGKVIGLIGTTVNLSMITKIINNEKLGNSGYAYMINSVGVMMAHPNKSLIFKENVIRDEHGEILNISKEMVKGNQGIGYYDYKGERKIISYKEVKSMRWSIGMTANYKEATKGIIILRNYVLSISIITIFLIIMLLHFVTAALVKPINKLKRLMEQAAKGDLSVQSDIDSKDEIGILSHSFNALITENKRLLEETIQYEKLKTEFFANVSHELKTPLNIIFSTTQLLSLYAKNNLEELTPEKLIKHINITKQNCYRLLRLVNNLIDITKIDSGFIELKLQNRNIVEVVENITMSTVDYVKSKSRKIIFDTDVEEKVMAIDEDKIERIILNLISNAVKFTESEDIIEVNIYDRGNTVAISVKDNGIGISKDKHDVIFERFRQVDSLYRRNHEGSGIGLSLVKSLAEMHGGNISVQSELGKGSEFTLEMPVMMINEAIANVNNCNLTKQEDVEKIDIEFSDIYF